MEYGFRQADESNDVPPEVSKKQEALRTTPEESPQRRLRG